MITESIHVRPLAGWFILLAVFVAMGAMVLLPRPAVAHEHRHVGQYTLVVGFMNEPAYEGLLNSVSIRITDDETGDPVEGLQDTLEVEVSHPETGASRTMSLVTVWGDPGHYRADFVPTVPGAYHFRFIGDIEGEGVDELFESGPGTFSNVEVISEFQFPETLASSREIQGAATGARNIALDAEDAASSAQTLAYVGIGMGLLGIVIGGAGLVLATRRR